jgi:putative ABC transport system ATP-binding protein
MSDMLRVEHLSREFRAPAGTVRAVDDVTFAVPAGGIVALLGRSGSGKTTLLNCITGLDAPTSGSVTLDGVEITALDDAGRSRVRRERIAIVFQNFGLLPHLTAAENIGLPLRLLRTDPAERERRVHHLLDLVGLPDRARSRPDQLSGGQQQRVAIARALAHRPLLLVADEPTGQLDAATGRAIIDLIRAVTAAEGATALIATHDPAVHELADRTLLLDDGRLLEPAPSES